MDQVHGSRRAPTGIGLPWLVTAMVAGLAWTSLAHAQEGSEACASAPKDLLASLDGQWRVQQGAGVMIVPMLGALPLPAREPLELTMTYDAQTGTSRLEGSGPDEQLIMFPTHESLVPQIQEMVSDADKQELLNLGEGCDWYALPLMVGTNTYSLDVPASSETGTMIALALPEGMPTSAPMSAPLVCLTQSDMDGMKKSLGRVNDVVLHIANSLKLSGDLYAQFDVKCNEKPASSGDLKMTLLVKFQSDRSGTGMLIFEMKQDGMMAIAKAPVTMRR